MTISKVVGHVLGWGLYVLGFVPWGLVVPIVAIGKLMGNQTGQLENEAVVLSLFVYGAVSLLGLSIIGLVLGSAHRIAKTALGVYLVLLAVGIVVRSVG